MYCFLHVITIHARTYMHICFYTPGQRLQCTCTSVERVLPIFGGLFSLIGLFMYWERPAHDYLGGLLLEGLQIINNIIIIDNV